MLFFIGKFILGGRMSQGEFARGYAELKAARADHRALLWAVGVFSVLVNLLMLTGPLYMLQVYDRVLGSRSEATLVALSVLVAQPGDGAYWRGDARQAGPPGLCRRDEAAHLDANRSGRAGRTA